MGKIDVLLCFFALFTLALIIANVYCFKSKIYLYLFVPCMLFLPGYYGIELSGPLHCIKGNVKWSLYKIGVTSCYCYDGTSRILWQYVHAYIAAYLIFIWVWKIKKYLLSIGLCFLAIIHSGSRSNILFSAFVIAVYFIFVLKDKDRRLLFF